MKRVACFIFLFCSISVGRTQDTISYGDSAYYFIPHGDFTEFITLRLWGLTHYFPTFSDDSLRVYGIAVVGETSGQFDTVEVGMARKVNASSFQEIAKEDVNEMTIRKATFGAMCDVSADRRQYCHGMVYFPCYELYFDKLEPYLDDESFIFISQNYAGNNTNFYRYYRLMHNSPDCPVVCYAYGRRSGTVFAEEGFHQGCWAFPILHPDRPQAQAVTGFHRETQGYDYVDFGWDDMQDYGWYNTTDSSAYEVGIYTVDTMIRTVPVGDTVLRIDGLERGVLYYARIRQALHHTCRYHVDTVVYGAWSMPIYFRLSNTVAIDGVEEGGSIEMFPNPADDMVNIKVPSSALPAKLTIIDETGRLMEEIVMNTSHKRFSIARYPEGVYYVVMHQSGAKCSGTLIVVR